MDTQALSSPQRRALIKAFAGLSGLALLPPQSTARASGARIQFRNDPFAAGIASGSPSPDGFVLWTRLLGEELMDAGPVPVRWELFEEGVDRRPVARGEAWAEPELGHAVHVEVTGLRSDRWYGYRFMVGGAVSALGRARTSPAPGAAVDRLRLALASCQRWESGHYAAYRHMHAESPDMVVFVGDYIYERAGASAGPDEARHHDLPEARTLATYRARYALYKSDPALQAMHAACPWLVTWDDHELENNNGGTWSITDTRDFAARRVASYQAYYEHMPLRADVMLKGLHGLQAGVGGLRIHRYHDHGRLGRLYLLDNRQYRDRPLCGKEPRAAEAKVCLSEEPTSRRSMLGREQEQWLEGALRESRSAGTAWNLIAQQTRFTPANYAHGLGVAAGTDGWDGYPGARQALIDALVASEARNPVILGGDIHRNWVAQVHRDPYAIDSPVVAAEYCGTSITSTVRGASEEADAKARRANPHCLLVHSRKRGYGLIDLSPQRLLMSLRVLDDATRADSGIGTLASLVTEAGRPGVQPLS
ncbi:alkaline phosphatase D family protein [Hylemonella gracilis]|uniref:Alkaline phosphatase n=1 Tax=Hylemonella gracilis ATCC 19624 TaxID=887062 RepID=F3KV86_9BURK|nr:alkaline phosphatase D family protein [Hylemonella gracilis]EGI76309.1 alkaline phosphatase [Hylemonella gracilis ATCC 19624]